MFVNCWARSTFEVSSVPVLTEPLPPELGVPMMAVPELPVGAETLTH